MKTIKKEISINAPREKVWGILFSSEYYSKWAAVFSDGANAETDWQEGSRVVFSDNSNSGLVGTITKSTPPEYLKIEYYAGFRDGKEDTESESAKSMIGAVETYTLTEKDGATHLAIASDMNEAYVDMMSAAWDKALQLVKELAENK